MKKLLIPVLIALFFGCTSQEPTALNNTFYVFNNGIRTLPNAPVGWDAQAALINKIGYDGIAGHISQNYFEQRPALDKYGLKMPEVYWGINLTDDGIVELNEEIKKIVIDSKDRDLLVAFYTGANEYLQKKEEGDVIMSNWLREFADFAKPYGARVAIYPHVNNYCETSEHSLKIAELVDRENMGVIFNTCHLLKVEGEAGWEEKALKVLPHLFMVSINGSDSGNTKEMDWDRLIQPLGEGSFDTYKLVKLFKDNGYEGQFGLQCYNIKEDCEIALTKSMNTWKQYQKRYAEE